MRKTSFLWMLLGVLLGGAGMATFIHFRLESRAGDDKIMAQLEELLAATPVDHFEPIAAHELPPVEPIKDDPLAEAKPTPPMGPGPEPGCTDVEPPIAEVVAQPKQTVLERIFSARPSKDEPPPYVADPVPLEPESEEGPLPRIDPTREPPLAGSPEAREAKVPVSGGWNAGDRRYVPAWKAAEPAGPSLAAFDFPCVGEHPVTLADSTVVLPEPVREQLKGPNLLVVTAGKDQCLEVYPASRLEQVAKEVDGRDSDQRKQQRLFYSRIAALRVRSDGSVRLPAHLVRYAGLGTELVVIGVADHFEIWDARKWEEYQAEPEVEPES